MRSIRNRAFFDAALFVILDHWEMRSIRNATGVFLALGLDFRSLGNALYPEHMTHWPPNLPDFRSLGNALYPEPACSVLRPPLYFRSLGNALQQKQQQIYTKIYLLPVICFCSFPQ